MKFGGWQGRCEKTPMSDSVRFSVIIPTRNRPQPLARCLAALAQQNYPRAQFETLVVDDGGDQSLVATLVPFQSAIQIALLEQKRAGPAAARNLGAARATGTFLAFTDDDCAPEPEWLNALEAELSAHPGSAVGGLTRNALTENIYATASQLLIHYLYTYYNRDPQCARFIASNNFALPRSQFLALGGFDVSFPRAAAEDRDFCDRWLRRGYQLVYSPDAVVSHASALTWKYFLRQHWGYGQGAWHFHQARAQRGEAPLRVEPLRFYRDLVWFPFSQKQNRAPLLSFLLLVTQVVNLAGFLSQAIRAHRK